VLVAANANAYAIAACDAVDEELQMRMRDNIVHVHI
jgi:hypothetical protein